MSGQPTGNQDKILYQIKRLGPQTVKLLAANLVITTMGIRQHLLSLETDGLVRTNEPVAQKRGRPVKTWALTASGHGRFPDAHAQVTTELIASVRDLLGESALDKVIEQRAKQSLKIYTEALANKSSLALKLKELARLRTEEGYMAEVEQLSDNEYLLIEQHCPICIAAESCQGFCSAELSSFQSLFESIATVERREYLLDGARRCSYTVAGH